MQQRVPLRSWHTERSIFCPSPAEVVDVCYLLQLTECAQEARSHRSYVECSYSLHAASRADCVNMSASVAERLCVWIDMVRTQGTSRNHSYPCRITWEHTNTSRLTHCALKWMWSNPAQRFETTLQSLSTTEERDSGKFILSWSECEI